MQIVLAVLSILLIISVFLSLVRNDFWIYKIFEYPRLQKLILIIVVLTAGCYVWPYEQIFYQAVIAGLGISIIYLFYKIWPYTRISKKEMIRIHPSEGDANLRIFSANVLQTNTAYGNMLAQIKEIDPDIILLLETNQAWASGMKELEKNYPYTLLEPLENTYGLLFYSRLKLEEASIKYLVKDYLPSVDAIAVLPGGEKFHIWGLHPEPPTPSESLTSTAKDKELMKVALQVRECPLPAIVFGDLNDVAWSHTTELFRKTSRMLDPRRGRGFYNTFSAHHWLIKFPLDYIFCSKEFALISMRRMPKNGSDHYAMMIHLGFNKEFARKQDAPVADSEEIKEAKKTASQPV